ncbi:MAG: glutamate synthase-related protein, partial [Candidatus Thermoplasmatota archaeon]
MEEIIRALKKKAEEGKHLLRHFNSSNINTDNIIVIPDRWAEDIYWEDVDTNIEIGVGIDKPLILDKPIFIEQIPYGVFSRSGRKAIIFGACLGGACIFLGDIPLSEDEREIANANNGKITSQWSGKRYGITPGILKNSIAVDIKLSGAREKVSSFFQKENLEYEWLLDVEAPNDLKKHIELIREVTEHKLPIIVRMGSENVYNNVKDAIAFGADAIQISGMECWGNAIPDFVAKSFDSPVIATFAPAIRALRETNAKEKGIKLIVSGGFF